LLHLLGHLVLEEVVLLLSSHKPLAEVLNVLSLNLEITLLHLLLLRHTLIASFHVSTLRLVHHLTLVGHHLGLSPGVLLIRGELLDLSAQLSNHLDKFDVFFHDVHVVLFVGILLASQTFL